MEQKKIYEGVDLFEDYENIPDNVKNVLHKYQNAFEDGEYRGLEKALLELENIGYTFEYELDGQAYDLRPIGTKGKSEVGEFAKGGNMDSDGLFENFKYKDGSQVKRGDLIELAYSKYGFHPEQESIIEKYEVSSVDDSYITPRLIVFKNGDIKDLTAGELSELMPYIKTKYANGGGVDNQKINDYSNSKNRILVGLKTNLLKDMKERYKHEKAKEEIYFFDNYGNHFATLFDEGTRYQVLRHNGTLNGYGWIKENKMANGGSIDLVEPYDEEKYTDVRAYLKEIVTNIFGKENSYSGSADWGGIPVWSVKGDKFYGVFIIIDDNNRLILMTRKIDIDEDYNNDEDLMSAEYDNIEDITALLNEAKNIQAKKMATGGEIICKKCDWSWDKKDTQPHDAYVCHKCGYDNELKKGIKAESEHIKTANDLYQHNITPNQAAKSIAIEHLNEDPQYYTKLLEKFKKGGNLNAKQKTKFGKVIREFYAKKLYSNDNLVTDKNQALAIAYSEANSIK